MKSGISLTSW